MKDLFTNKWITANAENICERYEYGVLTIRALHYQLVSLGMTNDIPHYKRVVDAMKQARWAGLIAFEQFSDLDREMIGETEYEHTYLEVEEARGKNQVRAWMEAYKKNRWENQENVPEVLIEKKALQGVFAPVCDEYNVALGACKGYPSLTFLNDMAKRCKKVQESGKNPVIIYFGDYDPSGEDIPRAIVENLSRFGVEVELKRVALMSEQVIAWKLPPAPAKVTDTRNVNWDGLGQVELDAVDPDKLRAMCEEAITGLIDEDLYEELLEQEETEREQYRASLVEYVKEIANE